MFYDFSQKLMQSPQKIAKENTKENFFIRRKKKQKQNMCVTESLQKCNFCESQTRSHSHTLTHLPYVFCQKIRRSRQRIAFYDLRLLLSLFSSLCSVKVIFLLLCLFRVLFSVLLLLLCWLAHSLTCFFLIALHH